MAEQNYTYGIKVTDAPEIRKLGVIHYNEPELNTYAEMTPFVWKNRLMRVETVWLPAGSAYFIIRDVERNEAGAPFAHNTCFSCAYCENDTVYVFGTTFINGNAGGESVMMFRSEDLVNWQQKTVLTLPGRTLFNTSVCKGPDGYKMAVETGEPPELVGKRFTMFFAESADLMIWRMLPDECCYTKQRYSACPVLRYLNDGFYYMIYLEELPLLRYAPYICRTKDFIDWEIGLHNPVMVCSPEDRMPKPGVYFEPEIIDKIRSYLNINDCDVDLCEFCGYTYINYLTGDQHGINCMCEAVYDGPMAEFLQGFFN